MAKDHGIRFYMMTINGVPYRRGFMGEAGKRTCEAMAERWQGSHSGNKGLLKHKDRGDYVETKRDYAMEADYAERIDEAQRGNPQKLHVQYDTEHTPL
jgi:hypothetical protein